MICLYRGWSYFIDVQSIDKDGVGDTKMTGIHNFQTYTFNQILLKYIENPNFWQTTFWNSISLHTKYLTRSIRTKILTQKKNRFFSHSKVLILNFIRLINWEWYCWQFWVLTFVYAYNQFQKPSNKENLYRQNMWKWKKIYTTFYNLLFFKHKKNRNELN